MAEREKKNANRSVSFRKLGSWSNRSEDQQHKSEDLEAAGVALPPEPSKAEQPLATRNVSVSRKVSKISATTTTTTTTAAAAAAAAAEYYTHVELLLEEMLATNKDLSAFRTYIN